MKVIRAEKKQQKNKNKNKEHADSDHLDSYACKWLQTNMSAKLFCLLRNLGGI